MQRDRGVLSRTLEGIVWLGGTVQILMGFLWILLHLSQAPILGTVRMAGVLCGVFILLHEIGVRDRGRLVFGVLLVATFPMVAQRYFLQGTDIWLCSVGLLFLAALFGWEKHTAQKGRGIGTMVLFLFLIVIVAAGFHKEHEGAWLPNPAEMAASRFGWSDINDIYVRWPTELQTAVSPTTVRETSFFAGNVEKVLVPALEEAYDKEGAGRAQVNHALWQIARCGLLENTREVVREIAWDALGSVLSPAVFLMQMRGAGYDSYSGINYDSMLLDTPELSRCYMRYGCGMFVVMLLLCLGGRAAGRWNNRERTYHRGWIRLLLAAGIVGVWNTLRGAGMMDYGKTLIVVCLWLVWMVYSMTPFHEK